MVIKKCIGWADYVLDTQYLNTKLAFKMCWIKQNEPEVGSDMLLVSDKHYTFNPCQ